MFGIKAELFTSDFLKYYQSNCYSIERGKVYQGCCEQSTGCAKQPKTVDGTQRMLYTILRHQTYMDGLSIEHSFPLFVLKELNLFK